FTVVDRVLKALGGLRWCPLRKAARRQCIAWILERQEPEGDIGGIFPPLHAALFALTLEGYDLKSSPVRRGIEALQNTYAWRDTNGLRMQGCISPIWDTILMTIGLIDSGLPTTSPYIIRSSQYLKARQQLGPEGDWRVYNRNVPPGGFSFEYYNSWYPDIDDTAATILALVKQDPGLMDLNPILSAIHWILGLQNRDGGWAAFDCENNYLFLNKIPFSDMDSFCDPSTADVTGRVLEAFGLFTKRAVQPSKSGKRPIPKEFINKIASATARAINFLSTEQEPNGSWYGRWGSNYIYGTSTVLCGLAYHQQFHLDDWDDTYPSMKQNRHNNNNVDIPAALNWLIKAQNTDGAANGPSTPSQTAWALMGLLAYLPPTNAAITRGIQYLTQTQVREGQLAGSWKEEHYTGTGFPNHFYLCYTLYSQYFPMMALGRYTSLSGYRPLEDLDGLVGAGGFGAHGV
ncbi:terpenoid cyclases/Protein prenyltransferase, partial [Aspergillus ibericus CBS 121593]